MTLAGTLAFFPWLKVPNPVVVGGFRFMPIDVSNPAHVVGGAIGHTVKSALSCHVDIQGKPINACTIALRVRHNTPWDIPDKKQAALYDAARSLALAAMAEHRFFEQLTPHTNSTVFQPVLQRVQAGSGGVSLFVGRRDGAMRFAGLSMSQLRFQMPLQAYGTECPPISSAFTRALDRARTQKAPSWYAIQESLPFFLEGHSEAGSMPDGSSVMLSALTFERLLSQPGHGLNGAKKVSEAFAILWKPYTTVTIGQTRKVQPDPDPTMAAQQASWAVHQKWMKELYEARNQHAHGRPRTDRSSNWKLWQHIVFAAFVYPLTVKLLLERDGLYQLSPRETGACQALDDLLVSNFRTGPLKLPEWSTVLSARERMAEYQAIVQTVLRQTP